MKHRSKTLTAGLFLLMTVLAVVGCSQAPPETATPPEEAPPQETPMTPEVPESPTELEIPAEIPNDPLELPESIDTTFLIEGMEEAVTLNLFKDETLPFYTYYPDDMLAETVSKSNVEGVRFSANYGGIQNADAYVSVMVYQKSAVASEEAFLEELTGDSGVLTQRNYEWVEKVEAIERMHDWTLREYFFMNDEFTGALYAGEYGNEFFYIAIHYPWEYGDGLEARAYVILDQFTWIDTGEGLLP
ncbi:MAG: hypothetical protein SCK57_02120 [Bacillota bacterium]|nr:hypothetical protein [Bacillota bacterium]MDW7676437.1 hypothetical protein [Bacillota bacterium]